MAYENLLRSLNSWNERDEHLLSYRYANLAIHQLWRLRKTNFNFGVKKFCSACFEMPILFVQQFITGDILTFDPIKRAYERCNRILLNDSGKSLNNILLNSTIFALFAWTTSKRNTLFVLYARTKRPIEKC